MNCHRTMLARIVLPLMFVLALLVPSTLPLSANVPPAPAQRNAGAQGGGVPAPIRLRAGTFDLARGIRPDIPADLRMDAYPAGQRGYYIVQFAGPVQEDWKALVAKAGGVVLDYLPDFAFIVYMDEAVRAEVAALPVVAAVDVFQPAYKLSSDLANATGLRELMVQTFAGESLDNVQKQAIALGAQVQESAASEIGGLLRLKLDGARLADLARIPAVRWIEPDYEIVLFNDIARGNTIMAAETAWTNLGLYGAGQIVAVADTGLDTGSLGTLAQDFLGGPTGCTGTGRMVAQFARGRTNNWSDSCGASSGGHGTHVSGSVLGNGCRSGSTGNPNYAGSYAGLAPQASLVMQSIMTSACGLTLPADLNVLYSQARTAGARIHTNSWGSSVYGQYTTNSLNSDLFLWNNKDATILFAASNDGVDANSDGYIDLDSIGAPGTAKNVITVGASENYRTTGGYNPGGACSTWGGCWSADYPAEPIFSDALSNNVNGMVAFSSRGPTDDGRIKPDVVAPGSNVLSTKSQAASGVTGGWGAGPSQWYQYMGGTSMATPLTAGAMALIRQFYTDIKSIPPSGALLKATVINSAVNMSPGQYASPLEQQPPLPNYAQGWGRVNVANATDDTHQWQDIADANGVATNDSHNYTYQYCGAAPLKVTLVWTDYPGATFAGTELVNDLDLKLTAPDGTTTYLGNVFTNGWAATGGSADRKNNVESVYVQTPAAGAWTVTVTGYNVPSGASGKQGYGLVVDGASTSCADFTVSAAPASQAVCAPSSAVYTVNVGKVGAFTGSVTLSASVSPTGPTTSFSANPVTPPASPTLTVSGAAAGTYNIIVTGTSGSLSHQAGVTLNVSTPLAAAPSLTAPVDGSTGIAATPTFTWGAVTGAVSYNIQVATDPAFTSIVASATGLTTTSYTPGSALTADTVYYWRAYAVNGCGSRVSSIYAFRTVGVPVCTDIIGNGGFESGRNISWSESSTLSRQIVVNDSASARTGSWYARLGGADSENAQVWQTAPTISAAATSATLTYWYQINSSDYCGYDYGYLKVAGTTRTTYNLCSSTGMTAYAQATYDMSSYKGTSPEIRFQATTDYSLVSTLRIDDVVLNVCAESASTTADYSDLASSYGIAWHTGTGAVRLGSLWTADTSFAAASDDASDDGVTRNYAESWNDTRGEVRVTVNGTAGQYACLNAWLDYSDGTVVAGTPDTPNGVFDANEHVVVNKVMSPGASQLVTWPLESGVINSSASYNVRFRLVPAPNPTAADCSGVTLAAADALLAPAGGAAITGGAAGGEDEDYTFSAGALAVTLADFSAAQAPGGDAIVVTWETVSELNNRGFNLWRGTSAAGPDIKLNDALIPSQSAGSPGGYSYSWTDRNALVNGATYYYWLEDLDDSGALTRHEPVSATYGAPTAVGLAGLGAASALPLALPLAGLALAGAAAWVWRRRRATM